MKKAVVILAVIACLGIGFLTVDKMVKADNEPPVFTFSNNMIYSDELSEEDLLAGVKARDDVDGDVTDSIVLESVSANDEEATVVVIYAARDSSNNVARASRILEYSDEKKEEVGYEDESETNSLAGEEGESESESETETETEEELPEGSPRIRLSENQVELTVGDNFSPLDYVESIEDDNDNVYDLWQSIRLSGEYDTARAGTYELSFYVVDSEGNMSNQAKMKIVVKQ